VSLVCLLLPAHPGPSGNSLSALSPHVHFSGANSTEAWEGPHSKAAPGLRGPYLGNGLATVGFTKGDGAPWEMALGIGLTLLSQFVLAMRLVLEEIVCGGSSLHPLEVRLCCHAGNGSRFKTWPFESCVSLAVFALAISKIMAINLSAKPLPHVQQGWSHVCSTNGA
jgi:hypothetical protein